jgi:xanthine/uracil permease
MFSKTKDGGVFMSVPKYTSPYDLDGRIPLRQAIPLGLQHVLAMFVGNLSPVRRPGMPPAGRQ